MATLDSLLRGPVVRDAQAQNLSRRGGSIRSAVNCAVTARFERKCAAIAASWPRAIADDVERFCDILNAEIVR